MAEKDHLRHCRMMQLRIKELPHMIVIEKSADILVILGNSILCSNSTFSESFFNWYVFRDICPIFHFVES
jgi:hypothetical protein